MNRFIGVFGPGRCGSSAVAGLLHHAGVPMGRQLIAPHPIFNPRGHFEDIAAHRINRIMAHRLADDEAIRSETVERYPNVADFEDFEMPVLTDVYAALLDKLMQPPVWGMKCVMLGLIWPHLEHRFPSDRRLILVEREPAAIIRSRMAHSRMSEPDAKALVYRLLVFARKAAYSAECPVLTVQYEQLIAEPEAEVKRILEFVSEGGKGVTLNTAAAINHISPELNHHASEQYCIQ